MCPDRLSLFSYFFRGSLDLAERALPGRGCVLLEALSSVADAAFNFGVVLGIALAYVVHERFGSALRLHRFSNSKVTRHGN